MFKSFKNPNCYFYVYFKIFSKVQNLSLLLANYVSSCSNNLFIYWEFLLAFLANLYEVFQS